MNVGVLCKYGEFLPLTDRTPPITIGEGDTPLLRARRLEEAIGVRELWLKLEGLNPTGSFKDRGMVVAVAKAIEEGAKAIMCASTGNTSASAAALAAHTGLMAIVLVPKGNIALGKLAQALIHGARVLALDGNFDQALQTARALTEKHPVTLVNSVNPYRIEGQTTAAFEICDALGRAPDYLCIPVGNAGNISAYWRGFKRYRDAGRVDNLPKMMGFEAAGAAPIVHNRVVEQPRTIATAIRIGNPASWRTAVAARDESGGIIDSVTDEEIIAAYRLLAQAEGIFCEPASAASVAGLTKMVQLGRAQSESCFVCVLTGNGLKDPENAVKLAESVTEVPVDLQVIEKTLGWLSPIGGVRV